MSIRTAPGKSRPNTMKRTTISLPADLLEAADREVEEGRASNRGELLAEALRQELRRRQRAAIDAAFEAVLGDPDYQAEDDRIMKEFEGADRESWSMIDEWSGQLD